MTVLYERIYEMLLIEELKVEVGDKEILQNVNLHVPPGETHILLDPTGLAKQAS